MSVHNPYDDTILLEEIDDIDDQLDDIIDRLILIAAALVIIDNEVGQVHTAVDAIQAMTDSMPILTETGGTLTTDGTNQTIYVNNAPDGVYKPICIMIDFANQTATETTVVRELYRITDGGALSVHDEYEFVGVVDHPIVKIDLSPTRHGIQVTIEKTVGTNRDYDWEVFYEATP